MGGFPADFIWGTACAAFQCEGAWDADGKGGSIWDDFCHAGGHVKNNDNGDIACDSYHRYREDIALAGAVGAKAHRFSVSWPRVLPRGWGSVNRKGLDYYDALVDGLLEAGIEPWMTLYHWDLPSALQARGGWQSRDTAEAFGEFAQLMGRHFDGRVRRYIPINEPQCVALQGYGNGEHAPGLRCDNEELAGIMHILALAQSLGTRALRAESSGEISVGTATCGRICCPQEGNALSEAAAEKASFALSGEGLHSWLFTHNIFLDSLIFRRYDGSAPDLLRRAADSIPQADWDRMEKPDFLGLNLYNGTMTDAAGRPVELPWDIPRTAIGWPVTPELMYYGPRQIYRRYGLPLVITENGMSCRDSIAADGGVHDGERIKFLSAYIAQLRRAMDTGVPVDGYLHWSLLDNFEWAEGYGQRFGLVYVDYTTQRRIIKDSGRWYAALCAGKGQPTA